MGLDDGFVRPACGDRRRGGVCLAIQGLEIGDFPLLHTGGFSLLWGMEWGWRGQGREEGGLVSSAGGYLTTALELGGLAWLATDCFLSLRGRRCEGRSNLRAKW